MRKNSAKVNTAAPHWQLSFDAIMEIVFLVIVFLVPVIYDRRLGIVFSGTKVAWLRAFVLLALAAWAIKLIVTKKHRFIRTPLDWPVLTFLLTTTIATLTSVHVYTSFTGFYGRFEGLTTWYLFGLLFFIATNYIRSFEQLKRVIVAAMSAAVLMSVYGVIQRHELDPYMWGGVITWQRVIGTIGQPNFLAAYILMAFFLTLVLFLGEKKAPAEFDWSSQLIPLSYFVFSQLIYVIMIYSLQANDILIWYFGFGLVTAGVLLFAYNYEKLHPLVLDLLLGACLVLIYICLLYTQSRGGYLGFFTGAVVFALIVGRHWLFKSWKELAILGLLIVAVSGVTMSRPEFSPFERFAQEISTREEVAAPGEVKSELELKGAAGSRGETWKSAFGIIADNPVFGIGPEVLKMVFPRYETELFRFKEAFHVKQDRCHNETFDVPVTKGLISFFAYLWILFTVCRVGIHKLKTASDPERLMLGGLLSAAVAYLVQNQFSFGVVAITSLFWVIWGMVMVLVQGTVEEGAGDEVKLSPGDIPWIPVTLVVLACASLSYVSFLSFRADILFKSGKTYLEMRQLPKAVEELKKSLEVLPFEGTTISHLGIAYLNMGNMEGAIKYLNYGTLVDPLNADNFYMLSRLYLSFLDRGMPGAFEKAWENVEIALKIDPYYAEAYETKGALFERQGKASEAAAMYEKAFAVNPNLAGSIQKIEELNRKLGRTGRAREIFEKANRRFPDSIEIFKALERVK
jgi:O-antigen ligase